MLRSTLARLSACKARDFQVIPRLDRGTVTDEDHMPNPFSKLGNFIQDRLYAMIGASERFYAQFNVTHRCNLSCRHCYIEDTPKQGELPFDAWVGVFDQFEDLLKRLNRKPGVVLCGGEPLISPIFQRISKYLDDRFDNCPLNILTNGTLVDDNWISFFQTLRSRPAFQISLDGPDADRHDCFRGRGSFDRSLQGIARLTEAGFTVDIQAILSEKRAQWIDDFFALSSRLGIARMKFTRLVPSGRAAAMVDSSFDRPLEPKELKQAFESILASSERHGVPSNQGHPLYHLLDPSLGSHNQFGFQGTVVDCDGSIKLSSRCDIVLGHIQKDVLVDVFLHHPLMKQLRNKSSFDVCGRCDYWKKCGGDRNVAYATFGNIFARDPGCWYPEQTFKKRSRT